MFIKAIIATASNNFIIRKTSLSENVTKDNEDNLLTLNLLRELYILHWKSSLFSIKIQLGQTSAVNKMVGKYGFISYIRVCQVPVK